MTTDLTPEEREAKLKQWLQRKELLDKGLEVGIITEHKTLECLFDNCRFMFLVICEIGSGSS